MRVMLIVLVSLLILVCVECGSLKVKLYLMLVLWILNAQCYISHSVADVLVGAEEERKRKYRLAAEALHASFSSFVVSEDGALAALFLGCIADRLSVAWGRSYGNVLGWLRVRLGFAVIRGTSICLSGSCVTVCVETFEGENFRGFCGF